MVGVVLFEGLGKAGCVGRHGPHKQARSAGLAPRPRSRECRLHRKTGPTDARSAGQRRGPHLNRSDMFVLFPGAPVHTRAPPIEQLRWRLQQPSNIEEAHHREGTGKAVWKGFLYVTPLHSFARTSNRSSLPNSRAARSATPGR
jgi:hypothetical protein